METRDWRSLQENRAFREDPPRPARPGSSAGAVPYGRVRPPSPSDTDVVLRDGTTLRLRALRSDDAAGLEDLGTRLAPLTEIERGPGWPPGPPAPGDDDDPARQRTLVAEAGGRLVAIA